MASTGQPSSPVSLHYLPGGSGVAWEIADSRGSLLLLYRGAQLYGQLSLSSASPAAWRLHMPALIVCDTLARRYTVIPCPQDLDGHQCLGLFLLDDGGDRAVDVSSSFRVMAALHRCHAWEPGRGVPVPYVFTPAANGVARSWNTVPASGWPCDGDWRVVKRAWSRGSEIVIPSTIESFYFAGRGEGGSFYWGIVEGTAGGEALILDEATAGFSTGMLPEILLGPAYDMPVLPTKLPVRAAIAAQDYSSARKYGVAMARACAERPGLLLLRN